MNFIESNLSPELRELLQTARKYSFLYQTVLRRTRALYLLPMLLVLFHILLHPLPQLRRVKNAYTFRIKELEPEEQDLFFVSAYYYGKEYSLYENQVSLVLVAPRDAHWEQRRFMVIWRNETNSVMEPLKVRRASPHNLCKFVTLVGTAVLKEKMADMEIVVNRNVAGIRYQRADNIQRDLVVCTPPIQGRVRWQSVLLMAHVYARFGGHLQTYLAHTTSELFQLLEVLKRLKGISVDALPNFKGKLMEIEFGGVTVANCDCLNKYRSSTSFITFLEWDELLLPKTHNSFFLEFAHYFESEIYVGVVEFQNPKGHIKIVTRPLLIDRVWLNEPVEKPYKLRTKRVTTNKVYKIMKNTTLDEILNGNFAGSTIINLDDLRLIEYDLKRTLADSKMLELLPLLKKSPPVPGCSESYIDFYTQKHRFECPEPIQCEKFPQNSTCIKSAANFELLNFTTNFWQPSSQLFLESVTCP